MESGKSSEIRALDLDRSDNISEAVIKKFIDAHHERLEGLVLTGMGQMTDMMFITVLPRTKVHSSVVPQFLLFIKHFSEPESISNGDC